MEELRSYLKSLSPPDRDAFARQCGTSAGYLFKAIAIGSKLGPALSVKIEKHSDGKVNRKDLHPTDWAEMWPELAVDAAA